MAAAGAGHADCAEELIKAGANPNAMDEDGACILLTAASRGKHE
jgi:ankyrin repeat protein